MNDITTTDLADFGARERRMAEKLLEAWRTQSLPEDFFGDEIRIMMNRNSGNVFLTNSEFQVAMMNGDRLESFYSCPQCGHEGFKEEMAHPDGNRECAEFLRSIGAIRKRISRKVH